MRESSKLPPRIERMFTTALSGGKVSLTAKEIERALRKAGVRSTRFDPKDSRSMKRIERFFLTAAELFEMAYGEMSISDAAKILPAKSRAILRATKRGEIKSRIVGDVVHVDAASLRAYAYQKGYRTLSTSRRVH